jgi:hypothetical protein
LNQEAANVRQVPYNDTCWYEPFDGAANRCFDNWMSNALNAPLGYRKVGKICMLPFRLGIPNLHHFHRDCLPGHLVCHRKGLKGEEIAMLSKLIPIHTREGLLQETRVNERNVAIVGYDFQSKQLIFRENTLIYIKRLLSKSVTSKMVAEMVLPNQTLHIAPELTHVRGPYYDYQAFFYWVDQHRQALPVVLRMKSEESDKTMTVEITGKYSFYLHRHIVPSPIKELLEFIKNHITMTIDPVVNQTLPLLQILEVTDGFVSRTTVDNQSSIAVDLPYHFNSLLKEN